MFWSAFNKNIKRKEDINCGWCANLFKCEIRLLLNKAHEVNPSRTCFRATITYCEDYILD